MFFSKERYCFIGSSWGLLDYLDLCFGRLKCFLVALCFVELSCVSNDVSLMNLAKKRGRTIPPFRGIMKFIHPEWKWRNVPRAARSP